jgi:hypothetical protein
LTNGAIYDEMVDAEGAGPKVFLTGELCVKTVAERITVKNRVSATEWAELAGDKTASLVGVEEPIKGVTLRGNFVEA